MGKRTFSVVANLDRRAVTWAATYCDAMSRCGVKVRSSSAACKAGEGRVLLGDCLDGEGERYPGPTMCFLAAVDGTGQERRNVERIGLVTTVSPQERDRAVRLLDVDPELVSADGFPLQIEGLRALRSCLPPAEAHLVCFLGRGASDKGPKFELDLAAGLIDAGYRAVHLSNGPVEHACELRRRGVEVVEGVSGVPYLTRLARCCCAINTSPRESLFVSGLEAAALGVMVLAPDVPESGIQAWNLPECLFPADDILAATKHALALLPASSSHVADVRRYDARRYADRIRDRLERKARP